jgi:hypothetical protein
MNFRSAAKWIGVFFIVFVLGGIGGAFFDRSLLPWLSVQRGLGSGRILETGGG